MNINYFMFFSMAGLIYLIVLIIAFLSKKRIHLLENNVYIAMIFCTITGIVFELIMAFAIGYINSEFLKELIAKIYLILI